MFSRVTCLTSIVLVFATSLTSVAKADLVGHWTFDEGSGTVAFDASGNGNDGTVSDSAEWVEGKIDGALYFNGTNSQVQCPDRY